LEEEVEVGFAPVGTEKVEVEVGGEE